MWQHFKAILLNETPPLRLGLFAPTIVIAPKGILFSSPLAMSVWKPGRARDRPTDRLMPKNGTPASPRRVCGNCNGIYPPSNIVSSKLSHILGRRRGGWPTDLSYQDWLAMWDAVLRCTEELAKC
ncbi:MAG: hypothetical protein FRX49_09578 [Trebouxia sp. A1-2]|nr:MAG: hypothetical protein FRX49_09578 [Trebouxia sp. A1-2]